MVVQQTFLSQAMPQNRVMRTTSTSNTGFPSSTASVVGASPGNAFFNQSNMGRLHQTQPAAIPMKSQYPGSHAMSHLINPESHGFATPPPSVMPSAQGTPTDASSTSQPQFMPPTSNAAMFACQQLLQSPAGAAAMAQNPMLLAAMTALNNGANWQHPSVFPALLAILQQNYDPHVLAAIQAALLQEAQMSQHRQLLAQLQQHQVQMAAAAAAAAMSQDQISMEKAAAAAAMHGNADPRLITHPQWMSPPLSANTPASSSSPLAFSGDELSTTGASAGTSMSHAEEGPSPVPRGDMFSPTSTQPSIPSSFDSLADYNSWNCDDVERILTEQSGLSEKESIAVAVLAGMAGNR